MRLIGHVNFENETKTSRGMTGETEVRFVLPRDIRKRRVLRLKYFGYFAGLHRDHPDEISKQYGTDINNPKAFEYLYRSQVKEVEMRVESNNGSILHDSIISRITDDVNGMEVDREITSDSITFPCVSETQAAVVQGGSLLSLESTQLFSVSRGFSKKYDLNMGYVESNSSFIVVKLQAKGLAVKPNLIAFAHSDEPNVRMDSISFVMELE